MLTLSLAYATSSTIKIGLINGAVYDTQLLAVNSASSTCTSALTKLTLNIWAFRKQRAFHYNRFCDRTELLRSGEAESHKKGFSLQSLRKKLS